MEADTMARINLRDHFKEYELNCFIEVTDGDEGAFIAALTKEVADVYVEYQRENHAYYERRRYNRAFYSLNAGDGIESAAVHTAPSTEGIFFGRFTEEQLAAALAALHESQRRRVIAHIFDGMTYQAIAETERVDESAIRASVKRALQTMKKYFI